jgi:hypothetical protein
MTFKVAWNKGRKLSEIHKQRISQTLKGKPNTWSMHPMLEETKRKISEAKKGKHLTEETRHKMSLAYRYHVPWNKGKKNCFSKETLLKMSLAQKGKPKPPRTAETLRRMSIARKGIPSPLKGIPIKEETKRKISLSNMGKLPTNKNIPHSKKTKKKISKSMQRYWDTKWL